MPDEILARLDQLSSAFARIADKAPTLRARFIVEPGRFGIFVLGRPIKEDGPDNGMIRGARSGQDQAFISDLYALTYQAGLLVAQLWQSGRYHPKVVTSKSVHYDLREHQDPWLMILLHTPPLCFQCQAMGTEGHQRIAFLQLGESEVPVWIDNYPQVCVSALAWLKTALSAVEAPPAVVPTPGAAIPPSIQVRFSPGLVCTERQEAEPLAEQISPVARAIAVMYDHLRKHGKLMKVSAILQLLPDTSRATLYRDTAFKAARAALKKSLHTTVPKGYKTQSGVEAVDHDASEDE